jgi:hypothetical protein
MWPGQAKPDLWPYALEHSVHIWNHLPNHHTRLAPVELFTGVKLPDYKAVNQARVWGCPAYVLDPTIQDAKKLPKWKLRSRCGMYVGSSHEHSSTVAGRILNLNSGAMTPQHHNTTLCMMSCSLHQMDNARFNAQTWSELIQTGLESQVEIEDILLGEGQQARVPFKQMYKDFIASNTFGDDDLGDDYGDLTETDDSESDSDDEDSHADPPSGTETQDTTKAPPIQKQQKNATSNNGSCASTAHRHPLASI